MEEIIYKDIPLGDCKTEMKSVGGKGSISEQLAESSVDVILGGGSQHFSPIAEGQNISVLEVASSNGFGVVQNRQQLMNFKGERLLGLFSPSTMPVRLQGENGRSAEHPETSWLHRLHRYLGEVTLPEPMSCEPNPESQGLPSLKDMTEVALNLLSANNDRGFFLMIESASIDKQSHERKPCGSIGELEQLEEALSSALAFAETHPETLILVTADHAQAAQIIPDESLFASFPIPTYTPGKVARIRTPEGQIIEVNYATTNFIMEEHTGAQVPLYSNARGIGIVPPFIQQPEIFEIAVEFLGL
jgi:alkaline phosphatase